MLNVELLEQFVKASPNAWIQDAIYKAYSQIRMHRKIVCTISGGSDSDIMLDLLCKLDTEKLITYVWFDTGFEFEATKRHLQELEQKYNIEIKKLKAKKPIPYTVRKYGVPFLSKQVSEMISRLQRHNFQWEDEPLDVLLQKYPKCKVALRWWCNDWGEKSKFNINWNPWLKEFLIQNPPPMAISNLCCQYAKKAVIKEILESDDFDLNCVGIRKAEGGARSSAYKSCFTPSEGGNVAQYRPLFWFDKDAKLCYKQCHNIRYSDCYEIWGLERTGCAACPFGRNFEFELECIEKYEPKLFSAAWKIFGASYEYTRKYREFQKRMRNENGKS